MRQQLSGFKIFFFLKHYKKGPKCLRTSLLAFFVECLMFCALVITEWFKKLANTETTNLSPQIENTDTLIIRGSYSV